MYNLKKQDVPAIGRMLLEAFKRNKADFIQFSHIFDGSFEAEMIAAIKAVKDRRRPSDVFDKQKKVTKELYEKMDEMQEQLRLLGEYVKMAEANLQTLYDHYHIKKARKALNAKNAEGVVEHCEQILDKINNDDAVALDAVGFDAAKLGVFESLMVEINDKNTEQSSKMDERQDVKAVEIVLFDAMYAYISKVSNVGKAMYTYRQKQRYDEFSVLHLKGRINHKRKNVGEKEEDSVVMDEVSGVVSGRVTDKTTDGPLERVVVRILGGKIMVDTDSDGEFYIDGVAVGVYSVSFTKKDYVAIEEHNVVVNADGMMDLRVELLAEEGGGL
jgi:Carboxypeptidase regulatory-like domain